MFGNPPFLLRAHLTFTAALESHAERSISCPKPEILRPAASEQLVESIAHKYGRTECFASLEGEVGNNLFLGAGGVGNLDGRFLKGDVLDARPVVFLDDLILFSL